jgi:hypothetical protein
MPVIDRATARETTSLRWLEAAEDFAERFAPITAIAVLLLFGAWAWLASRAVRFQFDELLELAAAGAPTRADVLSFLASGVDFNPPLSHFLVRASVVRFGEAEWAARLPAFAGLSVLLVCLYSIAARQLGRVYGVIAMLLILCLPVRAYAIQARPYGLVLGLTGLSLVLYGEATGRRWRIPGLAGLALCTAALAASHYYAVLVIAILVIAAMVRAWEFRRVDWPLLASCCAPPAVILFLLRNVIAQQKRQLTHYFARGSLMSFDHGYDDLAMDPLVYCTAILIAIVLLYIALKSREPGRTLPTLRNIHPNTLALAVGLLALPLVGAVVTQFVTHAYLTRYFLSASVGFALCICYGLRVFAGPIRGLAPLLLIPLGLGFGKTLLQEAHHSSEGLPPLSVLSAEPTPLLFDTPEAYLQIYRYQPAMRNNIWVIADPAAALRYRQYDTDDRIMLALASQGQARTINLAAAVRKWPAFRLVPRSADSVWALKCLMDAGASIGIKHSFTNSNFIFNVSVRPGDIAAVDACSLP